MIVLSLVQATAVRLGLPVVTVAIGSGDPHIVKILAAMQDAAGELLARYPLNRQIFGGLWLRGVDGRSLSAPRLDTDEVLIDERLMKPAILWRWRSDNGFDYAEDFRAAEEALSRMGAEYTRAQRGRVVQL